MLGVDFEKRIPDICRKCRSHEDIEQAFVALQKEMEDSISPELDGFEIVCVLSVSYILFLLCP